MLSTVIHALFTGDTRNQINVNELIKPEIRFESCQDFSGKSHDLL